MRLVLMKREMIAPGSHTGPREKDVSKHKALGYSGNMNSCVEIGQWWNDDNLTVGGRGTESRDPNLEPASLIQPFNPSIAKSILIAQDVQNHKTKQNPIVHPFSLEKNLSEPQP